MQLSHNFSSFGLLYYIKSMVLEFADMVCNV